MTIPICSECGVELEDCLDMAAGMCLDCQMDPDRDTEDDTEDV